MKNNTPANNQYYIQELQSMRDRIDNQMRQFQNQNQMQQPVQQPITQNFQLAPSQQQNDLEAKYVDNIEQVKNTFVIKTGIFATRDFKTIWVKDVTGNIKMYETKEVIELDEKDREILDLQKQVNELKGMIENANKSEFSNAVVDETDGKQTTKRVTTNKKSNAE